MNAQWWVSVLEVTLRSGWLNGPHGDKLVIRVDDGLLGKLENGDGARPKGMGGVIVRSLAPPYHLPSSGVVD